MKLLKALLFTSFISATLANEQLLNRSLKLAIDGFREQFSPWLCYQGAPIFKYDKDQDRTTCAIVTARGFPCETHFVTTYDNYIIEVHRISPQFLGFSTKKPVILQPGLIGTSTDFVMATDNVTRDESIIGHNLAIELTKQGYDVWMSNNRGSKYGKNHTSLSSKEKKFWDFSFQDMSEFDTPAIIDYVKKQTKSDKVHFIGHSQGTAVMFALLSQTDKYNEVVSSFTAISPITRIGDAKTAFRYFLAAIKPYLFLIGGQVFGDNQVTGTMVPLACDFAPSREICLMAFFAVTGPDCSQLDKKRLGVYYSHMTSSTSAKNLLHFYQLFKSNKFQKYDYGKLRNKKKYNQTYAPEYDLKDITHPSVYVIYSDNDWFIPISSVDALKADLTTAKEFYEISNANANHIDPLVGIDVTIEVNKKILQILNDNDV